MRQVLQAVNSAMVQAYWNFGGEVVEEEQRGAERAEYGSGLVESLARDLTAEFGTGFSAQSLWFMRDVYLAFPIVNALRSQLSWTHCRLLARVQNLQARGFYEAECEECQPNSIARQDNTIAEGERRISQSRDHYSWLKGTRAHFEMTGWQICENTTDFSRRAGKYIKKVIHAFFEMMVRLDGMICGDRKQHCNFLKPTTAN